MSYKVPCCSCPHLTWVLLLTYSLRLFIISCLRIRCISASLPAHCTARALRLQTLCPPPTWSVLRMPRHTREGVRLPGLSCPPSSAAAAPSRPCSQPRLQYHAGYHAEYHAGSQLINRAIYLRWWRGSGHSFVHEKYF